MSETFSNGGSAVVGAGGIDGSSTTLPTLYRAGLPASATFRIRVESEILKVTTGGQSTASWTVARGQEGTTAAAHTEGTPISQPLTAAAISDALAAAGSGMTNPMSAAGDLIVGGTAGAATRLAKSTDGKVLTLVSGAPAWAASTGGSGGTLTPPDPADWTWISGPPTNFHFYKVAGKTYFYSNAAQFSSTLTTCGKTKAWASGTGNIIACLQPQWSLVSTTGGSYAAIGVRESSTGRFVLFGITPSDGTTTGNNSLFVESFSSLGTMATGGTYVSKPIYWMSGPIWLRIRFNAGAQQLQYYYSLDGVYWTEAQDLALGGVQEGDLTNSFWTTGGSAINQAVLSFAVHGGSVGSACNILHFATDTADYPEINFPAGEPTYV